MTTVINTSQVAPFRSDILSLDHHGGSAAPEPPESAALRERGLFAPGAQQGLCRVGPASFGQASLWLVRQLMPDQSAYHTAVEISLTGDLDAAALVAAVHEIVLRHESLRTTFITVEGTVRQVVTEGMTADLAILDLSSSPDPAVEAQRLARATATAPFDLARGPLVRVRLLRLGDRDHRLVVVMDHLVADGMSRGIIWSEIEALYRAFQAGEPSPLPPPASQHASCIEAQNRWLETRDFVRQLEYWTTHLEGVSACELPKDRPRPPVRSFCGGLAFIEIPRTLTERLRTLSASRNVSLFASLLAGLDVLLARYSGQRDVAVMVPMACRQHFAAEAVVGYCANMVALRTEVPQDLGFDELVQRVNDEIMAGVLRQDVPFEKVIEALHPERGPSHDPVANVSLSFLPSRASTLDLPGVATHHRDLPTGGAKLDLSLIIYERTDHMAVSAEYDGDIFDASTIEALLEHYRVLLASAAAAPSLPVSALPLLTAEERSLLDTWNATNTDYPRHASIQAVFEAQVEETPEAVAVSFGESELTYRELDRRANQLARYLRRHGVGSETPVGLLLPRSLETVVATLAVLKAGGAYVPLDRQHPPARLAWMLEDARASVVVTLGPLPAGLSPALEVIRLDLLAGVIALEDGAKLSPSPPADGDSLAYVMYTSGSTGTPKGVCVIHRGVVRLVKQTGYVRFAPDEVFLHLAPAAFDASTFELWGALLNGSRLVVFQGDKPSVDELGDVLRRCRVTTLWLTAGLFNAVIDARAQALAPLRQLLVGGEALSVPHVQKALAELPGVALINGYGPTEGTTFTCCFPVASADGLASIPIGRPIANTTAHVLDRHLSPVPVGVPGELYAGGDGVARGYLNRPELTAERFVPDPFSADPAARLYRTGDLVRWLPDGTLQFLGRTDHQVKIRGHRIELGEIEATLAGHPAVREAVVVAREDQPGDVRLAAYVVPETSAALDVAALRSFLAERLLEPMVPAAFVALAALPLTSNGKLDRMALPPPPRAVNARLDADASPRDALEIELRTIWEEVLGVHGIGVHDNFFEIGGHSLLALRLFDRISRAFGVNLPIASLFRAPTIAGLRQLLRREGWAPSWSSLVPIQTAGTRRPLFCVHAIGCHVLNYRLLSKHLGDAQPVYGIQARGLSGNEPAHATVEEMAAAYIHEMQQEQPCGPYQICGASSGGVIAFEMAQQLRAVGERVSALVMLDTYRMGPPPDPIVRALASSPFHDLGMRLDVHFGQLLVRTPVEGLMYLAERLRRRVVHEAAGLDSVLEGATPTVRRLILSHYRALSAYVPRPYPGPVVMLLSRDAPNRAAYDGRLTWADLLEAGLTLRFIPGTHENMLEEPQVARVAATIACFLGR